MSNFGDFIGQCLAEITTARVQADLESVRLADFYATHPLLKSFPVPRFRLPTVTIDVPLAVSEVQAPPESGAPKSGLKMGDAHEAFRTALQGQLKRSDVTFTKDVEEKIYMAMRDRFKQLSHSEYVSTSAVHLADSITKVVEDNLSTVKMDPKAREQFVTELRDTARVAIVKLLPTPPRVKVVTNTAQLRELGPQEFLTRVQLNITEQGVEWKGDGGSKRLVPE
jgi:hypothetical protein